MSDFSTSTMSVWERVQNKKKQKERKRVRARKRDLIKLAEFLYCAMLKAKHISVFFRHAVFFLDLYLSELGYSYLQ